MPDGVQRYITTLRYIDKIKSQEPIAYTKLDTFEKDVKEIKTRLESCKPSVPSILLRVQNKLDNNKDLEYNNRQSLVNSLANEFKDKCNCKSNKTPYSVCQYIPNNILEEMKKETLETNHDKLENGFAMCTSLPKTDVGIDISKMTDKNTLMTQKCKGSICEIDLPECPPNLNRFGAFHTHPSGMAIPSINDLAKESLSESTSTCIGADKKIRCFPVIETFNKTINLPNLNRRDIIRFWKDNITNCEMDL